MKLETKGEGSDEITKVCDEGGRSFSDLFAMYMRFYSKMCGTKKGVWPQGCASWKQSNIQNKLKLKSF